MHQGSIFLNMLNVRNEPVELPMPGNTSKTDEFFPSKNTLKANF